MTSAQQDLSGWVCWGASEICGGCGAGQAGGFWRVLVGSVCLACVGGLSVCQVCVLVRGVCVRCVLVGSVCVRHVLVGLCLV